MNNLKKLLFFLFFITTTLVKGQILDPYRFIISRYFDIELTINSSKEFNDNYIDFNLKNDSALITISDTSFYVFQKNYTRTTRHKRIILYYFQRRKLSDTKKEAIVIRNCRIIKIDTSALTCLCRVADKTTGRKKINRREINFDTKDLDGIIVGMNKTTRTVLIFASIYGLTVDRIEFKEF